MDRSIVRTVTAVGFLGAVASGCSPASVGESGLSADRAPPVRLAGHVPEWAGRSRDLGALAADEPVTGLSVVLARSPERESAWQDLLVAQQTPGSPEYRSWLTPEEIADRFGPSPSDVQAVKTWLESRGLHVDGVANSRAWITFGGTAASVGKALSTEFHRFDVAGESHISAITDPAVPSTLTSVVHFIAGLSTVSHRAPGRAVPGGVSPSPLDTFGSSHYVAPGDFATIYDVAPAYAAGIDGTGETIAIIGRSRVTDADITKYQQNTGLPVRAPTVVIPPMGVDPGVTGNSDQQEATMDVARASGVAHGATIHLVVSGDPPASMLSGIAIAIEYAVDNNIAPVLSISFGACEQLAGPTWTLMYDTIFQQAAAEGMSVFVAAGDGGVAGCDTYFAVPPASQVASTNYICSSGNVTCVGGTEFADTASPATYWNASNTSTLVSAKSYIPEGAWNEPLDKASKPEISEGGGGPSVIITKPTWQKGTGVPADGYRDTPDIAFTSSWHDGYYGCYSADPQGDCATGSFEYFVGTSAATPSMAGIAALAAQKAGKGLGNLNPLLYTIGNGTSASKVFHDVTVATSGVNGCTTQPSMCNNSTPGPSGLTGGLAGYLVGPGYDLATGWGSLDVANFLDAVGSGSSSGSDGGSTSSGSDSGTSSGGLDSGTSSSGGSDSGSGTSSGSGSSSGSTSSGSGSGTSSGSTSGSTSGSGTSSGSTSSGGSASSSTGGSASGTSSGGNGGSNSGSGGAGSSGSGSGDNASGQGSSGCSCDAVGARSSAHPAWAGIGLLVGLGAVSRRRKPGAARQPA